MEKFFKGNPNALLQQAIDDNIQAYIGNNNQNGVLKELDEAIKTGNWTKKL